MDLLTDDIRSKLLANAKRRQQAAADGEAADFFPVVKLFLPGTGHVWLLSEIDPQDPDITLGIFDIGLGYPKIGIICLSELQAMRSESGSSVERDPDFTPTQTISAYFDDAYECGRLLV